MGDMSERTGKWTRVDRTIWDQCRIRDWRRKNLEPVSRQASLSTTRLKDKNYT